MTTTAVHLYFPSKEATEVSWEMAGGHLKRLGFSPWLVTGCCRTGTLTLPLCASLGLSAHFASPDASQVRVFSVCLCKWFLPVFPDFPLSWGPSTVPSCQVLCDAVLLTHLASFPPISEFQLLLIYPSFFHHSFFLQTGLLRPPPCSQLYHI